MVALTADNCTQCAINFSSWLAYNPCVSTSPDVSGDRSTIEELTVEGTLYIIMCQSKKEARERWGGGGRGGKRERETETETAIVGCLLACVHNVPATC